VPIGTMGVDRIVAATEADYIEKTWRYIANLIRRHQESSAGCFVYGVAGANGHVRRSRAADILRGVGGADGIDWKRVIVFLLDERYGVEKSADCNADLVRGSLLKAIEDKGASLPAENFFVPDTKKGSWEEFAEDYKVRVSDMLKRHGGANLVTVNLASDLSIASVFPEWYRESTDRWEIATSRHHGVLMTETTHFELPKRIAMSLRVIREAKNIVVLLGGQSASSMLKDSSGVDISDMTMADDLNESSPTHGMQPKTSYTRTPRGDDASRRSYSKSLSATLNACNEILHEASAQRSDRGRFSMSAVPEDFRRKRSDSEDAKENFDHPGGPASPLSYIMKYSIVTVVHLHEDRENHYSIIVFGAAGDLAKKKTIPAIFNLYMSRCLPTNVHVICCDDLAYHGDIKDTGDLWTNRYQKFLEKEGGATDREDFRKMLFFVPIKLDDAETMSKLHDFVRNLSGDLKDNRVFYLAQPPFLFEHSVRAIRQQCWSEPGGWVRVIVEKPFGRDLESAQKLTEKLGAFLAERQIYRIDHYLAKAMVLNILTLRFANRELGRLFHADSVANIRITFKEDIGVEGRAGYFDNYGIIRDIMQNHLLQLLTLVTMEGPASLSAEDVRNEKVKILKQIRPVELHDCVIGQYEGYQDDPQIQQVNKQKGYRSKCPTFAVCVLYLDNERWSGVPLILKAGKHVEDRATRVRLQFKKAPPNSLFGDQPQNELVIRVQPNEAIYYRLLAKTPGISSRAHEVRRTVLDLDLKTMDAGRSPEAYEKLINDVIKGEGHNFVRADEVEEGWRIFDPLLKQLEKQDGPDPFTYKKGSRGPKQADELINSMGFRRYTMTGVQGFAQDHFD